jgi:hypothetical protein
MPCFSSVIPGISTTKPSFPSVMPCFSTVMPGVTGHPWPPKAWTPDQVGGDGLSGMCSRSGRFFIVMPGISTAMPGISTVMPGVTGHPWSPKA